MAKVTKDGSEIGTNSPFSSSEVRTEGAENNADTAQVTRYDANSSDTLNLNGDGFLTNAVMTQEGHDLVMTGPTGEVIIVENYFLADPQPNLISPEGQLLSPSLVQSFMVSDGAQEYASADSFNDESAIGIVSEFSGSATVTRSDGTSHTLETGMAVFQGDIIETEFDAAVNITFIDESSFSIGEDARMAIDEFVFDPATNDGTTNVSILRGVFMYTSGLMGRDNPDSVAIDTPVGSIGIRGTIIGGKITANGQDSQITIVEGAIVVTNGSGQQIISSQFETVKLNGFDAPIENIGQIDAAALDQSYGGVRGVSGNLFSSIDAANNNDAGDGADGNANQGDAENTQQDTQGQSEGEGEGNTEAAAENNAEAEAEAGSEAEATDSESEASEAEAAEGEAAEGQSDAQGESGDAANAQDASANGESQSGSNTGAESQSGDALQMSDQPQANLGSDASQAANSANSNNAEARSNSNSNSNNNASDSANNAQLAPVIDRAPTISVEQSFNLLETDNTQTILAKLNISDPDINDSIDLSRITIGGLPNDSSNFMRVIETNGDYFLVKMAGAVIDYESSITTNTLSTQALLNVVVYDNNTQKSASIDVPFDLINENEIPELNIEFRNTGDSDYNIAENGGGSQIVAKLDIQDEDIATAFNNNTISVDDSRFEIVTDGSGFAVKAVNGQIFDAEAESSIALQITVEDSVDSSLFTTYGITVNVVDVNDPPTIVVSQSISSFDENDDSFSVGTITFNDEDTNSSFNTNQAVLSDSRFEVIGNDVRVKAGAVFDYETDGATINLNIVYEDTTDSALNDSYTMSFALNDLNDEAPTDIYLKDPSNTSPIGAVDENLSATTVVATINAVDPDGTNSFTYTLSGTDASFFDVVNTNQIELTQALDFETQAVYNFDITVDDGNGNTYIKNMDINLADVAETPTEIILNDGDIFDNISGTDYHSIVANEVQGAYLGYLGVVDPENDVFSASDYSLSHPTDASIDLTLFLEIVEIPDQNGDLVTIIKLQDDVSINYDSASYSYVFVKGGTEYDLNMDGDGNPEFNTDANSKFAFDVRIEVSDAASGGTHQQDFKFSVENHAITLTALSGEDGFIILNDARNIGGSDPDALFGSSVTSIDFDGDGMLDIAIGAENAINGYNDSTGGIYIMDGYATDPGDFTQGGQNTGFTRLSDTIFGNTTGYFEESYNVDDKYGAETTNLGDVNGDGYDDLFVSRVGGGVTEATILFGGSPGLTYLQLYNLTSDVVQNMSLSYVGDVNGDGFDDIMIGLGESDSAGAEAGEAILIYGAEDLDTLYTIDVANHGGAITTVTFDGSSASGVQAGSLFGQEIAGIGDFNGDGYDDVAIGEPNRDSGEGSVHILMGNSSGMSGTPNVTFTTTAVGALLGSTITAAGDINGDGLDDLLISSDAGSGAAYMIFGQATSPGSTADIDTYVGTSANGFLIEYGTTALGNEGLGYSMAGGGDFNGDGHDDFIITGVNGEMIDTAYLVYGGDVLTSYLTSHGNILQLEDLWTTPHLGTLLDYENDLDLNGNGTEDQFIEFSFAGDLNNDGFDDLFMTAEQYDDGAGATYVVYGRDSFDVTMSWEGTSFHSATAPDQSYVGDDQDNSIDDGSFDGLSARGAAGNDLIKIETIDFKLIDGGTGQDLLALNFSAGEGAPVATDIDLRDLTGTIENIEEIFLDTSGPGGDDRILMDLEDILDLLHQSETGSLVFSTDDTGNDIRFFKHDSAIQLDNSGLFTNDADNNSSQDMAGSYYKYTLIGTDYTVLLDSQLASASTGGQI